MTPRFFLCGLSSELLRCSRIATVAEIRDSRHEHNEHDTDADVVPALEAGATGYLLKDAPRAELVRAVRAAQRGESVLAPSVATRLVSQLRTRSGDALSDRELEVLTLIAQGETNRGAAALVSLNVEGLIPSRLPRS